MARCRAALLGLLLGGTILRAAEVGGEVVLAEAFAGPALPGWLQASPQAWTLADGALQTLGAQQGMSTLEFRAPALDAWRLSFRVRRLVVPDTDQHFGVILAFADGTRLRVYCRGKTMHYWDQAGDKTLAHESLGNELSPPLASGPQAPWSTVRIAARGAYVDVDLDGRSVGRIRREASALQQTQFYAYHLECALDDLCLERLAAASPGSAAAAPAPVLALQATFDGSPAARAAAGDVAPLAATGLTFVDGVLGQAIKVSPAAAGDPPLLQYPAGDAFAGAGGTVMFWFRPDWDGAIQDPERFPWYGLLSTLDGAGKTPLRIWQWHWLRADLSRGEGLKEFSLNLRCRGNWLKGDWHHVALTWNEEGWCTLYTDGIPYELGLTWGDFLPQRAEASLTAIRSFSLGSTPERGGSMGIADGSFDELRVYRSPLPAAAVMAEYHRACPVDLIVERRFLPAAEAGELVLELHPGGAMVVPPVGEAVPGPAEVSLRCRLTDDSGAVALVEKEFSASVKAPVRLPLELPALPAGDYRLTCVLASGGAAVQRSYRIVAYELSPARPATADSARFGEPALAVAAGGEVPTLVASAPTAVKALAGVPYREAGPAKADRFAFEVEFAEAQTRGEPVLLEVAWPDDVPRSMGLYMYPESRNKQHRDRLEGGTQSGEEYPLSGQLQTTRYLFYPDRQRYLFEARTLVSGMPAAVASLSVRPLLAPLPRLAVAYPPEGPHRRLGHLDEDQSFEVLFRDAGGSSQAVRYLESLCDYFDYTGQELISYPLLRYHATYYPSLGSCPSGGLRPEGWIDLLLQVLHRRGKQLLGTVNLYTVPDLYLLPARVDALIEAGAFLRDAQGDLVRGYSGYTCNPLHPMVHAAFLRDVGEILRRYGSHPGFGGLDLWVTPAWTFTSLDHGYDDATVAQFTADTGTALPAAGEGRDGYRVRHAFLTGPARAAWLAWRARRTTAALSEVDRLVRSLRPDLPVYLSLGVEPWKEGEDAPDLAAHYYRDLAIDVAAVRQLPSVVLAPQRHPTDYRHAKHWDHSESRFDEVSLDRSQTALFRAPGRASSGSYLTYFESFNDSLKPEVYAGYFQNADVKPHGRYFLQEFAFCLAAMDTTQMLIGAQPLGTAGRDDVVREFARAYGALPIDGFSDAAGPSDPVTVRYLSRGEKTYLYAVNTLAFPVEASVGLSREAAGTDLATGESVTTRQQGLAISLLPFQLRSFRLPGLQPAAPVLTVDVPGATVQWYREQVDRAAADIQAVAATGADVTALQRHATALRRAFAAGALAETHRLLFAKPLRELAQVKEAALGGFLAEQTRLIATSTYAVNCGMGGVSFYRAASGTLFFPDQEFQPGCYGYVGPYKSVVRPLDGILGTQDATLYATEAYDIEGYRFAVTPGRYTVRLYLKVGYEPGAKPGIFVISVDLEGTRVMDKADLFLLADSDFHRALVKEFRGIEANDGVLDVQFSVPDGGEPTARLCNAIEVVPEP